MRRHAAAWRSAVSFRDPVVLAHDDLRPGGGLTSAGHPLRRDRMGRWLRSGSSARTETHFGNLHWYRVRRKFMVFPARRRGPHGYHGFRVPAVDSGGRMEGVGTWAAALRGAVRGGDSTQLL